MLLADMSQYFFGISIFFASGFLILLVLVQRGRGGGLTGALGGPGGQSAFGTKAGDLFTKITIGIATVWIFLCAAAVYFLKAPPLPSTGLTGGASIESPANESVGTGATGSDVTSSGAAGNEDAGDSDTEAGAGTEAVAGEVADSAGEDTSTTSAGDASGEGESSTDGSEPNNN